MTEIYKILKWLSSLTMSEMIKKKRFPILFKKSKIIDNELKVISRVYKDPQI